MSCLILVIFVVFAPKKKLSLSNIIIVPNGLTHIIDIASECVASIFVLLGVCTSARERSNQSKITHNESH